mgnify:CR=1 FL=1
MAVIRIEDKDLARLAKTGKKNHTTSITIYVDEVKPVSRHRYAIKRGNETVIVNRDAVATVYAIGPKLYKVKASAAILSSLWMRQL